MAVDGKFNVENCDKGDACLKVLKAKDNIPRLLKKLLAVKPEFGKSAVVSFTTGDTKTNPADSCSFVYLETTRKMNGFFWIKNSCSKDAHKVYCDYSQKQIRGYYLENQHEFTGINIRVAHQMDPGYFIGVCKNLGFNLATLHSAPDIEQITLLALTYSFNFNRQAGVLIGYDFGCMKGECSGLYHSLDGTVVLNAAAKEYNEKRAKEFNVILGNEALMLVSGQMKTIVFQASHVNSVPCQSIQEVTAAKLEAGMTFADLEVKQADFVYCNITEAIESKTKVFGELLYAETSSVCRAMIHSGEFKMRGVYAFSKVTSYKGLLSGFKSTEKHGIKSDALDKQLKAYSFSPDFIDKVECPVNRIQTKKSASFIQRIQEFQPDPTGYSSQEQDQDREEDTMYNGSNADYDDNRFEDQPVDGSEIGRSDYFDGDIDRDQVSGRVRSKTRSRSTAVNTRTSIANNTVHTDTNRRNPYNSRNFNFRTNNGQTDKSYSNTTAYPEETGRAEEQGEERDNHNLEEEDDTNQEDYDQEISQPQPPRSPGRYSSSLTQAYRPLKHRHLHRLVRSSREHLYRSMPGVTASRKATLYKHDNLLQSYNSQMPPRSAHRSKKNKRKKSMEAALNGNLAHKRLWNKWRSGGGNMYNVSRTDNALKYYKHHDEPISIPLNRSFRFRESYRPSQHNYRPEQGQGEYNDEDVEQLFESIDERGEQPLRQPRNSNLYRPEQQRFTDNGDDYDNYGQEIAGVQRKGPSVYGYDSTDNRFKSKYATQLSTDRVNLKDNHANGNYSTNYRFTDFNKLLVDREFFKSDESKKNDYYLRKKWEEYAHYMLFSKLGDTSTLKGMFVTINNESTLNIAKEMMALWRKLKDAQIMVKLGEDLKSLNSSEVLYDGYKKDYNTMNVFAVSMVRTANKELANTLKMLYKLEDKYLAMFKYIDSAYYYDIVSGVSMPLPDTFMVEWFKRAVLQGEPNFKVTKQDVSPFSEALVFETNATKVDDNVGVILSTRYHKIFDGSIHLSFRIPHKAGVYTFIWRYNDQFSYYGISVDYTKQFVSIFYRDAFSEKILLTENMTINEETWYRLSISTFRYIYKIWLSKQMEVPSEKLDVKGVKREMAEKPTFTVYHAGYKEGRIGFICSDCKGALVAGLQMYADKCWIKPSNFDSFWLHSPKSARYSEKFNVPVSMAYHDIKSRGIFKPGQFEYGGPKAGKQKVLFNTGIPTFLNGYTAPAQLAIFKDRLLWCYDHCVMTASVFLDGDIGSANLAFKYKGPYTTYFVTLRKGKKKDELLIVENMFVPKKLLSVELDERLKFKLWYPIRISCKADKLTVKFNNKLLVKDYEIPGFHRANGTYGFGMNRLKVSFADIAIKAISMKKPVEKKKKSAEMKGGEGEMGPQVADEVDEPADDQNAGEQTFEIKEETTDYVCLSTNTFGARTSYCETQYGGGNANSSNCALNFCDLCCMEFSKETMTCVNKCNAGFTKLDMQADQLQELTKTVPGNTKQQNYEACAMKCASINKNIYTSQSVSACDTACLKKFGTNEDSDNGKQGQYTSMLRFAYWD